MDTYKLLTDSKVQPSLKAGQIVYKAAKYDYGLARDDTNNTGVEHISVTLNSDGDYPTFTHPVAGLEKIEQPVLSNGGEPEVFSDDQWWLPQLDAAVANGTPDQKRAVAVVRNLIKQHALLLIENAGLKSDAELVAMLGTPDQFQLATLKERPDIDVTALRTVLNALLGPAHHIRELQVTRGLPGNPLTLLVDGFNDWCRRPMAEAKPCSQPQAHPARCGCEQGGGQ